MVGSLEIQLFSKLYSQRQASVNILHLTKKQSENLSQKRAGIRLRPIPLISLPPHNKHDKIKAHWKVTLHPGGMAEWLKAPVLKTGVGKLTVGSNPSPSA
jgi:hypothetical protein